MGIQVDPKNVVGRDRFIESVWNMLRKPPEEGSLRFLAERRVGKTTIITKMAAEPDKDLDVLFLEVEGIDSCDRLTELLLNRFRPLLTKTETAKSWFKGIWEAAGGIELGGVIHSKRLSRVSARNIQTDGFSLYLTSCLTCCRRSMRSQQRPGGHTNHLHYSTPSARFGSAIEIFG